MTVLACPSCRARVDRLQPAAPVWDAHRQPLGRSPGAYTAYPCTHWLTPRQARIIVDAYREAA